MKRIAFVLLLASFAAACGSEFSGARCCFPIVTPNVVYTGSYVSDAGVTTQVRLIRDPGSEVQLTLERDGKTFTQTFQATYAR